VSWTSLVLPELVLAGTALAVLLLDLFLAPDRRRLTAYLGLAGTAAALAAAAWLWVALEGGTGPATIAAKAAPIAGMLRLDTFALVFKLLFLAIGLLVVLLSIDFVERRGLPVGEFYSLLLFAVLGMMLMAASRDLVMIYLGLETTSIASYALAGLLRRDLRSGEAALKYFLTGALASAVILFGMSLIYGATGSTDLAALMTSSTVRAGTAAWFGPVALAGLVLLIVGFGFKVAAVPFHFWAPDAYEGAPTPVTTFFSVGPKAASFAVLLRVFGPVLGPAGGWSTAMPGAGALPTLFAVLAVVTMTVGNLTALSQRNIKRMLAYSSIAHAGYALVGLAVAAADPRGLAAIIYYLLAYAAMNTGAFAVVIWLNNRGTGDDVADYVGLGRRAPLAAIALVVCFLSLIGIPPTAGFFGKFYLFLAAIGGGMTWLAVVMVVNSAISVGYYYSVVRNMYLRAEAATEADGAVPAGAATAGAAEPGGPDSPGEPVPGTPLVGAALGLAVLAVFVLGFLFEPLARLAGLAGIGM